MSRSKLPRGIQKYIRRAKARLKRTVSDTRERERLLKELRERFHRA